MAFRNLVKIGFCGGIFALAAAQLPARAQQTAAITPEITAPGAGATVASPVIVSYGLGSSIADAGHHRTPHAYLVIDSATPAAGSALAADADHVAFPPGQSRISVVLARGAHELQVVFVNKRGEVSRRIPPSAPVNISVK